MHAALNLVELWFMLKRNMIQTIYGLAMLLCKQAINVESAVFGTEIRFPTQIVICTGTCFFDVFRVKGQNTKSAMKKKSVLLNQLALGSGGQKLFGRYKIQ